MRRLLEPRYERYETAEYSDKARIAWEVVREIKKGLGRFLKEDPNGWFVEVPDELARQKISIAFRDMKRARRRKRGGEKSSGGRHDATYRIGTGNAMTIELSHTSPDDSPPKPNRICRMDQCPAFTDLARKLAPDTPPLVHPSPNTPDDGIVVAVRDAFIREDPYCFLFDHHAELESTGGHHDATISTATEVGIAIDSTHTTTDESLSKLNRIRRMDHCIAETVPAGRLEPNEPLNHTSPTTPEDGSIIAVYDSFIGEDPFCFFFDYSEMQKLDSGIAGFMELPGMEVLPKRRKLTHET
jgi:hypothetical protein